MNTDEHRFGFYEDNGLRTDENIFAKATILRLCSTKVTALPIRPSGLFPRSQSKIPRTAGPLSFSDFWSLASDFLLSPPPSLDGPPHTPGSARVLGTPSPQTHPGRPLPRPLDRPSSRPFARSFTIPLSGALHESLAGSLSRPFTRS